MNVLIQLSIIENTSYRELQLRVRPLYSTITYTKFCVCGTVYVEPVVSNISATNFESRAFSIISPNCTISIDLDLSTSDFYTKLVEVDFALGLSVSVLRHIICDALTIHHNYHGCQGYLNFRRCIS